MSDNRIPYNHHAPATLLRPRDMMNRLFVLFGILLGLGGCALQQASLPQDSASAVPAAADKLAPFSVNPAGGLPAGWVPMVIFHNKKQTQYQLVTEQGKTVLHAYAANASSGLMQNVSIEPSTQPWLQWQWKIGNLGDAVIHAQDLMEDSPARIILGFDGDKDNLPFSDQILFETAKIITGHDFPYATLMYVWDAKAPLGTIARSHRSSRIRTLVAANGTDGVGQWRDFTRNIVADFEKAYGEKPGKLIGVGVLTDTDYSGETVETWYGDINLLRHLPNGKADR